jgi:hypothetical protein
MQDNGGDQLEWRDTYFILFKRSARPTVTQVEASISRASQQLRLEHLEADDEGMFESVLVQAPQDNAALEISYESGDAVIEQTVELARQLKDELDAKQLQRMLKADARLDVMLFERVSGSAWSDPDENEDNWEESALDPSSLLNVVQALSKLTHGVAIDPASGAIMS